MNPRRVLALAFLPVLVACGSGAPSNDQVRDEIQGWLASRQPCSEKGSPCVAGAGWQFPLVIVPGSRLAEDRVRLDALVEAGLLARADTTATVEGFELGPTGGSYDKRVPTVVYRLTDAGRKSYLSYDSPGLPPIGAFRYGTWRVVEVSSVTKPAEALGQTYVTARFTRRLEDVPAWAGRPVLQPQGPEAPKVLPTRGAPVADEVMLVRGPKGWTVEGR